MSAEGSFGSHLGSDKIARNVGWNFVNSYSQMPEIFFEQATPATFPSPKLYILNENLAQELGLDLSILSDVQLSRLFSGQDIPDGAVPIAQAYAGHQFGGFSFLGDGRAILIGEHRTSSGRLVDIQLKGSGQTRFSRRGDGRAALGPMLREYIVSEAMFYLGVPTTRSLAVTLTGETVIRDRVLRGAVLTRVASSHIRVGTFELLAALKDQKNLQVLADYTIARHFPEALQLENKYLKLLEKVVDRQAHLVALWQSFGFIHGVMNTDNAAISGETIDYGPCAFMDTYDPETVYSSIDHAGRYSYGNQPRIAQWNMARFAEALLPLLSENREEALLLATQVVRNFSEIFQSRWLSKMRSKLGLFTEHPDDSLLVDELLQLMKDDQLDYTNTLRQLGDPQLSSQLPNKSAKFQLWLGRWTSRLEMEGQTPSSVSEKINAQNPCFIARNHLVEQSLAAAENNDDLELLSRLMGVLRRPFDSNDDCADLQIPPDQNEQRCYQTFCGT